MDLLFSIFIALIFSFFTSILFEIRIGKILMCVAWLYFFRYIISF